MIGGQVGIIGHLTIADDVKLAGTEGASKSDIISVCFITYKAVVFFRSISYSAILLPFYKIGYLS